MKQRLKNMNVEIKNHFYERKKQNIRRNIRPENGKSLWSAVLEAKDLNDEDIPDKMFANGVRVETEDLEEAFAELFESKINLLSDNARITDTVYNGQRKLPKIDNFNFMTKLNVRSAMESLKLKNAEGFDRIPQRILIDGAELLNKPMTMLMSMIYRDQIIPEQWKMSVIRPVHKKGPKNEISNYRPVANLCSGSKVFERLILQRINQIEEENEIDLTNEAQHGFKKSKSTTTAGLAIQSALSRALDQGHFAVNTGNSFKLCYIDLKTSTGVLGNNWAVVSGYAPCSALQPSFMTPI